MNKIFLVVIMVALGMMPAMALQPQQIPSQQGYVFPSDLPVTPKPPEIELEVLTPGCEKLLQYTWSEVYSPVTHSTQLIPGSEKVLQHTQQNHYPSARNHQPEPSPIACSKESRSDSFEKNLKQIFEYNWNRHTIATVPETVSVTFAINAKAEFSEFKLDKSSGNTNIDHAALELGDPTDEWTKSHPWFCPPVLPPGSPSVVVFRATLHTTPEVGDALFGQGPPYLRTSVSADPGNTLPVESKAIRYEDPPYVVLLKNSFYKSWNPRIKDNNRETVSFTFVVNTEGKISEVVLDKSSRNKEIDQAVLDLCKSANASHLPHDMPPEVVIRATLHTTPVVALADYDSSLFNPPYLATVGDISSARNNKNAPATITLEALTPGVEKYLNSPSIKLEVLTRGAEKLVALVPSDAQDKSKVLAAPSNADFTSYFVPYMDDLQRRINSAWLSHPRGDKSSRVVVTFNIHRGGELSNLRIDHSSRVDAVDQSALDAVKKAAPFRTLPLDLPLPAVAIRAIMYTPRYKPQPCYPVFGVLY